MGLDDERAAVRRALVRERFISVDDVVTSEQGLARANVAAALAAMLGEGELISPAGGLYGVARRGCPPMPGRSYVSGLAMPGRERLMAARA